MDSEGLKTRLRARLKAVDLTPRAASLEAGMGPDVVRQILNGRSRNPKHQTVEALAKALACSYQWLATGNGPAPDEPDYELAQQEEELLSDFRAFNAEQRAAILQMARAIKSTSTQDADIPG